MPKKPKLKFWFLMKLMSANIGCITHLQAGTELPVRHWIELLDEALNAS